MRMADGSVAITFPDKKYSQVGWKLFLSGDWFAYSIRIQSIVADFTLQADIFESAGGSMCETCKYSVYGW